jgi:hypothetical protein
MNVYQLKQQLAGIPDDAIVVRPGSDHSYRLATVDATTAMVYLHQGHRTHICEDHGDEHNEPGGRRINVLLFT